MISYKNLDFFFHLHLLLWLLESMLENSHFTCRFVNTNDLEM